MSRINEIAAKYGHDIAETDGAGLSVSCDIGCMREAALGSLQDATSTVQNVKDAEKRKASAVNPISDDKEWTRRWVNRQANSIKEQRRVIKTAQDMLADIVGILDKADAKLAEVK